MELILSKTKHRVLLQVSTLSPRPAYLTSPLPKISPSIITDSENPLLFPPPLLLLLILLLYLLLLLLSALTPIPFSLSLLQFLREQAILHYTHWLILQQNWLPGHVASAVSQSHKALWSGGPRLADKTDAILKLWIILSLNYLWTVKFAPYAWNLGSHASLLLSPCLPVGYQLPTPTQLTHTLLKIILPSTQ